MRLGSGDVTVASGKSAVIDVDLIGTAGLMKDGFGTLTLTAANMLTGFASIENGTLTISSGGSLSSSSAFIAAFTGSTNSATVNVTGAGSLWEISGETSMTNTSRSATLNITSGGTVNANGNIRDSTLGNITLTIEGGTLDMQNNSIGSFSNGNSAPINTRNFRSGKLKNVQEINNGTVPLTKTTTGTLILDTANGYTGGTAINDGVLHVSNAAGSATGTGTVTVASVATLQGTGFIGGPVQNNGSVAPGASAGILTIENSYTQSAGGTLEIEISGTTLGSQYDSLAIIGNAALDGIVDVALVNGFLPVAGQQFTILTATSIVDNGLALGGPAASSFSLLVNSSSVILQAIGLPGDYNGNGSVDAADYVLWRRNNNTATTLPNDSTPGTNQSDYTIWRAHFGQSASSGAGAASNAAVPEPATLMLLILAAAVLSTRRSRAAQSVSKLINS